MYIYIYIYVLKSRLSIPILLATYDSDSLCTSSFIKFILRLIEQFEKDVSFAMSEVDYRSLVCLSYSTYFRQKRNSDIPIVSQLITSTFERYDFNGERSCHFRTS